MDILAHAIDNPAPSTIVLISGERDFAYALAILRLRCYRVVLITLSNAHPSLRAQASLCFNWVSDVLEPVDPIWSHQPTPPRASSTPDQDKFYLECKGHIPSRQSFDDKNTVGFVNHFQDGTWHGEHLPKAEVRHDLLPPDLQQPRKQPIVSSAAPSVLRNRPKSPAIYLPVTSSSHTHLHGSIETPSTMTSRNSNSSRTTLTTNTSAGSTPKLTTYESILPSRFSPHSALRQPANPAQNEGAGVMEPVSFESSMRMLPDEVDLRPSSKLSTYSLVNVNPRDDPMANNDNHSGHLDISLPQKVTPPPLASAPSSMSPSNNAPKSAAATQRSLETTNPNQPTSLLAVAEKFRILIQCLKSHRLKGNLRPLRSKIGLEIYQNGTTYREAGVVKFSDYVDIAQKAGIIELGGLGGSAWIALRAPWNDDAVS